MHSPHDIVEAATAWRHDIHRHPELGFREERTAALVADRLDALGIDVTRGVGGTGVVATVRSGSSDRAIALRADMDALPIAEQGDRPYRSVQPDVFHGCGHDGHTAMLLGAAHRLAANPDFDGAVHLVFQPCEETGHGAQAMIDDGLFERFPCEAIYGMHNMPGIAAGHFAMRPGPMMSFEDNFEITIRGRGGHASMPERTVDAILVGAEVVTSLQTIVARSISSLDNGVVSVTEFVTDGARNVIASNVTIRGDCRGFTDEVSASIEQRMRSIVAGISAAHGAEAEVIYSREFVVLNNHPVETGHALAAARAVVGDDKVDGSTTPIAASEDFARFLLVKPGCYVFIGNGTDRDTDIAPGCASSLHNPHYDFNDDLIGPGIDFWVELVQGQLAGRT